MRRIKPQALRQARLRSGLSRPELARRADVFSGHIGKLERGDVLRTSPTLLKLLSAALEVGIDELAEPSEISDIQAWALRNDKSRSYALILAQDERIEGAYQDESGRWHMDEDAPILGPTALSRERWREWWDRYGRDQQRRRRAQRRARSSDGGTAEVAEGRAHARSGGG